MSVCPVAPSSSDEALLSFLSLLSNLMSLFHNGRGLRKATYSGLVCMCLSPYFKFLLRLLFFPEQLSIVPSSSLFSHISPLPLIPYLLPYYLSFLSPSSRFLHPFSSSSFVSSPFPLLRYPPPFHPFTPLLHSSSFFYPLSLNKPCSGQGQINGQNVGTF